MGEIVPTIDVLWKIANTLGVPFGSLISSRQRRGMCVLKESQKERHLFKEWALHLPRPVSA